MIVTKENAEYFKIVEARTVEINERIIKGRVDLLVKNMARLIGAANSRGAAFIRRQAKAFAAFGKRNVAARCLVWIFTAYKTDAASGEEIIQLFESFFAQLRAEANPTAAIEDYWQLIEQEAKLASKRNTLFAKGDKQKAREVHQEIIAVELSMPNHLKQIAGRKSRKLRFHKQK